MNDAIGVLELLMALGAALVLLWFVWSVFVRRYWRVVRVRDAQRMDVLHLVFHQRAHRLDFVQRDFEDKFVVHLQRHARLELLLP